MSRRKKTAHEVWGDLDVASVFNPIKVEDVKVNRQSRRRKQSEEQKLREQHQKFVVWLWTKYILYGEAYNVWWEEKGFDDFLTWARDKGLEFVEEKK